MGFRQQRLKKEHSILGAALPFLEELARAPGVHRVIPGRIRKGAAAGPMYCTLQYPTPDGFKLLVHTGSTQEVFVVSSDPDESRRWLEANMPRRRDS